MTSIEVPQQAPQSISPFNSVDPFTNTSPVSVIEQNKIKKQEIEQYLWYLYDPYGNFMIDQYGPVVVDVRNGIRVFPVDQYGNTMPFPLPQKQKPVPVPTQGMTTTSRIIRDTGSNDDLFLLDEDFFLADEEKSKYIGANDIMNYYNGEIAKQYAPQIGGVSASPVNITSTMRNIKDMPVKIRYTKQDFDMYNLTSEALAKYLLDKAFSNHPELRYSLTPIPEGFHEMTIFKNGVIAGKFTLDLENWGGKGLPIMHGIIGKQFKDNHIIVPLGATMAVEECITNVAYDGDFGVDAVTEAKFKHYMLPEYIYATVDFNVTPFPEDLDNYKQFAKVIEHIDKYYELKTRYRLYGYKDNFHFTLVSDSFVKPLNGVRQKILNEVITVENNTLTIKEPSGNIKVVQMGA